MKGGDLSNHITSFAGVFKDYMREYLVEDLQRSLYANVQLSANILLSGIPSHFRLENTGIILNCLIRSDEIMMNEEFWSFAGDGTFYIDEKSVHQNDKLLTMGAYAYDQGDFQFFISNESASSMLASAQQVKYLRIENLTMPKKSVNEMIKGISRVY